MTEHAQQAEHEGKVEKGRHPEQAHLGDDGFRYSQDDANIANLAMMASSPSSSEPASRVLAMPQGRKMLLSRTP